MEQGHGEVNFFLFCFFLKSVYAHVCLSVISTVSQNMQIWNVKHFP